MRLPLLKSCLVLMLAMATACGGVSGADVPQAPSVGETSQEVLYPPAAPASGNMAAPTGYALQLDEEPLTPALEETQTDIYWGCEGACNGWLTAYNFPWPYTGQPMLDMATRTIEAMPFFDSYAYYATGTFPYADLEPRLLPVFSTFDVLEQLLATYGNGTEDVRVAAYASPLQGSDFNLFVILFPESRKVVTLEQEHFW